MEMVGTVIIVIGFVFLAWYLKTRMATLERDLAAHKTVLNRLEAYCDIFDPEKLRGWVKNREETASRQQDTEIQKLQSLMEGLVVERFETGKRIDREIGAFTDLIVRLLFHAPPHIREETLAKMPNSMFKDVVRMVLNRMPEYCHIFGIRGPESKP